MGGGSRARRVFLTRAQPHVVAESGCNEEALAALRNGDVVTDVAMQASTPTMRCAVAN